MGRNRPTTSVAVVLPRCRASPTSTRVAGIMLLQVTAMGTRTSNLCITEHDSDHRIFGPAGGYAGRPAFYTLKPLSSQGRKQHDYICGINRRLPLDPGPIGRI